MINANTKVGTTLKVAIGAAIFLVSIGAMGERWQQSIKDDARINREIVMAHIDSVSARSEHKDDYHDAFIKDQLTFNSDQIDFRRRVEARFGWR